MYIYIYIYVYICIIYIYIIYIYIIYVYNIYVYMKLALSGILVSIYILVIIADYSTFEKTFYFLLSNLLIRMSFSK